MKVGRAALDREAMDRLEQQYPDISFDWDRILREPPQTLTEQEALRRKEQRDARDARRKRKRPAEEGARLRTREPEEEQDQASVSGAQRAPDAVEEAGHPSSEGAHVQSSTLAEASPTDDVEEDSASEPDVITSGSVEAPSDQASGAAPGAGRTGKRRRRKRRRSKRRDGEPNSNPPSGTPPTSSV